MDEREQRRKVRHRLAVLRHADEVSGNVAATCRYHGIRRPTFYKWLPRYEEHGEQGLRDKSSQPHTSPKATSSDVVAKIMYLRQHDHFGPMKISMSLARYHDVTISPSDVYRLLKRLGLNRLPASQRYKRPDRRWRRYEKPQPGHRVQVDVKFIEPLPSMAGMGKRRKRFYLVSRHEAVRVVPVIRGAREVDRPVGRDQSEVVPSSPPRLADFATLQNHVVDEAALQLVPDPQPGLPGVDDHGVDVLHPMPLVDADHWSRYKRDGPVRSMNRTAVKPRPGMGVSDQADRG